MDSEIEIRKINLLADFFNNLGVATAGGGIVAVMILVAQTVMLNPMHVASAVILVLTSFASGLFCHLVARSVAELRTSIDP